MAADCSPGRKPGVSDPQVLLEPREGRKKTSVLASRWWLSVALSEGSRNPPNAGTRAYARGFTLSPAFAGSFSGFVRTFFPYLTTPTIKFRAAANETRH
jgi:hypothetical protein